MAVVEHQGRYVVGQRPVGVPLAGLWEFPGGKVHVDESPAAAAVRECHEETGLVVGVCGEFAPVVYDYSHGRINLRFFACRLLGADASARAPFKWVDVVELARLEFPPANGQLLSQLLSARP